MSAVNGNGKSNLLISYLFPKGTGFEGQCALEDQIKNTIAKAIKEEYPDVHFVIADEECISEKILSSNKTKCVINNTTGMKCGITECCGYDFGIEGFGKVKVKYCPLCGKKIIKVS